MKFIDEIKDEWNKYKKQIIGATLLANAMLCVLIKEWGFIVAFLVAALALDLYLTVKKEDTITKWVRRQCSGWMDKVILICYGIFLFKTFGISTELGQAINSCYWLFICCGHLHWEK